MHRQRQYLRVILEDARGPVALVDIQVDHGRPANPPLARSH